MLKAIHFCVRSRLFLCCLAVLGSPAMASFSVGPHTCAPRYNIIIKSNPAGTPVHEEYKRRFFITVEALGVSQEESVQLVGLGVEDLVGRLQSGDLPEATFWEQVNTCDDEFGFPRSKP